MANDININTQRNEYEAYEPQSGQEELNASAGGDEPPATDSPASATTEPAGQTAAQNTGNPSATNAYSRYGMGDTVVLGRPDYTNIGRNALAERELEPGDASTAMPNPIPTQPPVSSTPPSAAPVEPPLSDHTLADASSSPSEATGNATEIAEKPAGDPAIAISSPTAPTSTATPTPSLSGSSGAGLESVPKVARDSARYAEAAAYGQLFGYSDEMIDKLAVLIESEPMYVFFPDSHFWTNMFPDVLIDCVDAVTQNADGTYNVNGAMQVRDYYVANDERFNTNLELMGGTQSGGSGGGGDEQMGDRSDDFAAMGSGNVGAYWREQASHGRGPLAGTYDSRFWNQRDIDAGLLAYRDRYAEAVTNGDTAAQAEILNELRLFNSSINPRISNDAAIARAFAQLGGNIDPANFARDENGRVVLARGPATLAFDDEGNLMPGVVDSNAPLEAQRQQLQARLQQQGLTPEQAFQESNNYFSAAIAERNAQEYERLFIDAEAPPILLASAGQSAGLIRSAEEIVDEIEATFSNGGYRSKESIERSISDAYNAYLQLAKPYDANPSLAPSQLDEARARSLMVALANLGERARSFGITLDPELQRIVRGAQANRGNQSRLDTYGYQVGGGTLAARQIQRAATQRTPSAANYRDLFRQNRPDTPPNYQVHHSLPQAYADRMAAAGINIHELQYLRGIDVPTHITITNMWRTFNNQHGGNPSIPQIQNFARQIDQQFGSKFVWPK
jgi:hypothetical protein